MADRTSIPEPSASRREQKKAATKQKLIDAAIDLYIHNGSEAATVHAITKRAGVSTRTFHNYFERRDDVFVFYLDGVSQHFAERVRTVAADHPTGQIVDIMRDSLRIYAFPEQPETGPTPDKAADTAADAVDTTAGAAGRTGTAEDPFTPDIRKFRPLLLMLERSQESARDDSPQLDLPTITAPATEALCQIGPNLSRFEAYLLLDVSFSIALRAIEAAQDDSLAEGAGPEELYDRAFNILSQVQRPDHDA